MTLEECKDQCTNNAACNYFTWFELDNECFLFSTCDFNTVECTNCYTGAANCILDRCFEQGVCYNGTFLSYDYVTNANDCLLLCKAEPDCKWFSFNPEENNICILTTDCPEIVNTCVSSNCIYGQIECNLNLNIMVATGYDGTDHLDHVEVINTLSVKSCSNLPAKYPKAIDFSVAMQHDSKMVICGGSPLTSDCYSYSNDNWNLEAFQLEPARYGAMSTEITPGQWLILGGHDDSNALTDTQLLSNGIFTQGPDLPEPSFYGSATMLNKSHLFIASGNTGSGYSSNNYLLNIDTNEWTQIAARSFEAYEFHASGTFWNSTAREVQIANIGKFGIEVYSPSDNSWQSGYPMPPSIGRLEQTAVIQQGQDSFFLIGGYIGGDGSSRSGSVYMFDENGLKIVKEIVLRVGRSRHVAMTLENFDCA